MNEPVARQARPIQTPRLSPTHRGQAGLITDSTRNMGIHLVAGRGSGKSRLMGRIIAKQDVLRGVPLVMLDPYGRSIDFLLDSLQDVRSDLRADALSRLVYVDMSGSGGYVVPFPLYKQLGDESLFSTAERFLEVLRRMDPRLEQAPILGWNSLARIGRYAGIVLTGLGLQITEVIDLLTNTAAWTPRLHALAAANSQTVEAVIYFTREYLALSETERRRQIDAFVTKILPFELDQSNRAMFGASAAGIDWQQVLDEGLAVLLDFRHELNPDRRRFKLLWVFTDLLDFIKMRGAGHHHKPLSFILDELTYLLPTDPTQAQLLESDFDQLVNHLMRNYMIWLTVAHQEMYQLSFMMQQHMMALGTQLIGVTTDPKAALYFAKRFYRYNPHDVRKIEPILMHDESGVFTAGYRETEFSTDEQDLRNSYKFMDLQTFEFLAAISPREGIPGTRLVALHTAQVDPGKFITDSTVAQLRQELLQTRGRRVRDVLEEIAVKQAAVGIRALSDRAIPSTIIGNVEKEKTSDATDDLLTERRPHGAAKKATAASAPSRRGRTPALPPHRTRPGDP